ncbi:MAG: transcription elongation factor GreA [Atopobiaceae bacterium]|nr:transcription elongation factor GreA [Atopobiaceae bacterium]MDO4404328.1 transcription elongation factor GreA [Atopobiaceae bacterium]
METKEIILTREGREKLVAELEELKGERREEIIERLKEARGFGDLSENAEYDAAREDQARNESRISEIEQILAVARIADGDSMSVSIGSKVEIEDERGKRTVFQIVGTTQTDSLNHLISNESPAGKAMIGHVAGDKVSFTTPSGKVREYTITNIEV